ncbi:MAG: acyl carrier protein [Hyphomicrobiaceae bacterium]
MSENRLQAVFRDVFDDDSLVISDATTAKDIEGWDSLSHVTLVLAVQRKFGVTIKPEAAAELENVGQFRKLLISLGAKDI